MTINVPLTSLAGDFSFREVQLQEPTPARILTTADSTRWGIWFTLFGTGPVRISTVSGLNAGGALTLTTAAPTVQLNFRMWGAIVGVAWWIYIDTPLDIVQVTEIFYRPR